MSAATTISSSTPSISLSTNDSAVLQALFDAESSPSGAVIINPELPGLPSHLNISREQHESLQAREKSIVSTLQPSSPTNQLPKENIQNAIKELDSIISTYPAYPSAYANRAQALRMLIESPPASAPPEAETEIETEINLLNPTHTHQITTLFTDLGQAITLASPRSPADPVSTLQAQILADSHTHRGYLLLRLARQLKNQPATMRTVEPGPDRFRDLDSDQLEEMASRDFFFGGRFGNKVAQQLAVQTNPYAKMCGAIVKEALKKEVEE